jgi:hypothetical protein
MASTSPGVGVASWWNCQPDAIFASPAMCYALGSKIDAKTISADGSGLSPRLTVHPGHAGEENTANLGNKVYVELVGQARRRRRVA